MQQMTTLEKVSQRVNDLSRNCTDHLIPIEDISFDSLESIKIANELHPMKPIAQQSIAYRLGIPIQYLRKCPSEVQVSGVNYFFLPTTIIIPDSPLAREGISLPEAG